jgi:VanZ family protein
MVDLGSRSRLPHILAALYGLAIAYASLQPFAHWAAPAPGTPLFVFASWPLRATRFDLIANVVAYAPFGFLVALIPARLAARARVSVALGAGAALSFLLESLQMFTPQRDASLADLAANAAGAALGGLAAVAFVHSPWPKHAVLSWRERLFLPGTVGDFGLALVAVWLAVQVNPGIALFASMFDPTPELAATRAPADIAAMLVEGAHSAFQLLGVGLFVALLLRERRHVAGAVLLLVGAALLVKGVAAQVLLKPAAWEHWLSPGVSIGVAAGALLLAAAIWLPRPAQVALAAVALLSSLLSALLLPDLVFARAPLALFDWSYGQLLNFNGLTHTVLLAWPVVASAYLFALAGRPGWGEPR